MKLHQQITDNVNTIRAFEQGSIRINNEAFNESLVVTADSLENWPVSHVDQLNTEIVNKLLIHQPEIILIGTGDEHRLLEPLLSLEITQQGTGIEIMSTEAACRTYNILLGEDRKVLAALIIEK